MKENIQTTGLEKEHSYQQTKIKKVEKIKTLSISPLLFSNKTKNCITSANWHITDNCNYNCKFCFMRNLPGAMSRDKGKNHVIFEGMWGYETEFCWRRTTNAS